MKYPEFSKAFSEFYKESGLKLIANEKRDLRSYSFIRWKKRHEQPDFDFARDCIGNYVEEHFPKRESSQLKPGIEPPINTPIHLTRKYDSLFQSFLGDLPEDTFDDELKEAFDYWKEHMDEESAAKYAALEILERYKYISPETSKYLQLKRNKLSLQVNQFNSRRN